MHLPNLLRMRAILAAAAVFVSQPAAGAPLTRDPGSYFALGFQRMLLKDLSIEAPSCNLGVNCADTGRKCGQLNARGASMEAPGQIVADDMCAPGSFHEVFRNNTQATCPPGCGMIGEPGPGPNCENTFETPILDDLDGDGQPSCDDACNIDVGDVAEACGAPYPLPPCDATRPVRVNDNEDCTPADLDLAPGNMQCDLPAGTYGAILVRNKARISFASGTTVACSLRAGKATRVTSDGPALVLIPGAGKASFNNMSDVGGDCREFKLVTEFGTVRFARHGEFHLDACSLGGTMRLGHDNYLRGRFFSGEFIISDYNNTGSCCGVTTTSTSTSSTTSSSTSTSSSSTTSSSSSSVTVTTKTTTTTSTSTTVPGICCEFKNDIPNVCSSAASAQACIDAGGEPGQPGETCRVGQLAQRDHNVNGLCDGGPATGAGCCELQDHCTIGGAGSEEAGCLAMGGTFNPSAECGVDGRCAGITTTTTTPAPTTTSTTLADVPNGDFTRTLGFYKTHPQTVEAIIEDAGGITVCGVELTNADLGNAHSALEAMCISTGGQQLLQFLRLLVTARLTIEAGGAAFPDYAACDALCAAGTGTIAQNAACINALDSFSYSGDDLPAPFDGLEDGTTTFCAMAFDTPCNVMEPETCS